MTFAVLRALHAIIGEALDQIETVYSLHDSSQNYFFPTKETDSPPRSAVIPSPSRPQAGHRPTISTHSLSNVYASPPPSPCIRTENSSPPRSPPLDFPSLDAPCHPSSLSESLTQHPDVVAAANRIIAACGQMTATVQTPFLTLCDASMGYHLPSCMRIFEASHTAEILREAGPAGLHVVSISEKNGVDKVKLAHILRLLATHHIVREVSPDMFTLNRISSTIDTGKMFQDLQQWTTDGVPEKKYQDTSGIAAFVGLCSDEIFKSSAYLTETYLLSPSKTTKAGIEPTRAPFCFAFGTVESRTGFFGWLEGLTAPDPINYLGPNEDINTEIGRGALYAPVKDGVQHATHAKPIGPDPLLPGDIPNSNRFRLERFGKAMSGTCSWEAPGAILNSFDWHTLPRGSVVVDVGGGIGSTSMLLASAFSSTDDDGLGLKFIIQDRPIVVEMGEKAWKAKCPELLENGTARFQVHDFFSPQPVKQATVFLLRVVLHDWPDDFARRILLHLREAATSGTKLLLGDFIIPLACPDETGEDGMLEGIQGAQSMLAPPPLLPNLGKASANAYWMDLTMQVMFNAQERTLREIVILAASAGWKVTRVTKCSGSLFGYIVAVPTAIPTQTRCRSGSYASYRDPAFAAYQSQDASKATVRHDSSRPRDERDLIERSLSRCGTPTFGSRMQLPLVEEALSRFGGGIRSRKPGTAVTRPVVPPKPTSLKQAITLTPVPHTKKKPSPLSKPSPIITSSSPASSGKALLLSSPKLSVQTVGQKVIQRRASLAHLRAASINNEVPPPLPLNTQQPPPSPMSPRPGLSRRSSLAQLPSSSTQDNQQQIHIGGSSGLGGSPSLIPVRHVPEPSSPSTLRQRGGGGIALLSSPLVAKHYLRDSGGASELDGTSPISHQRYQQQQQQQQLTPQNRTVGRRLSVAQLQLQSAMAQKAPSPVISGARVELRKRTRSVVGLSRLNRQAATANVEIPDNGHGLVGDGGTDGGGGDDARFGSGFLSNGRGGGGGGGTRLEFERERKTVMPGGLPEFSSFVDVGPGLSVLDKGEDVGGSVSVLAAAARIDKGVWRRQGSPS